MNLRHFDPRRLKSAFILIWPVSSILNVASSYFPSKISAGLSRRLKGGDLAFAWPETRYSRIHQGNQGCPRVSRCPLKFACPRSRDVSRVSLLVGGVLFFRWLGKLAGTGPLELRTLDIRDVKLPASYTAQSSRPGISKKEFHNVPLSADRYNRARGPRSRVAFRFYRPGEPPAA